ncbi:hypothetical protein [Streptomyces sp. Wb2n-11]|uniref:hypothetical protein n=1 Tax=Streptomyces sp. Wb2n-11 TaxID=1030533 RepID=UPI000A530E19|nr:hypothetical protein [Streptomyces sp. Wb2n-11]
MPTRPTTATALTVLTLLGTLALTGCGAGTQSPPAHEGRLKKAAGIGSMDLTLTKGLWETTRPAALNDHKTTVAAGERGRRGLIRITLSGTQLGDYLTELDKEAHCGWGTCTKDTEKAAARRVYDTLGPAIDRVKNIRTADDPTPEVIIDDTLDTKAR